MRKVGQNLVNGATGAERFVRREAPKNIQVKNYQAQSALEHVRNYQARSAYEYVRSYQARSASERPMTLQNINF